MYPQVESPLSPQDQLMNDPTEMSKPTGTTLPMENRHHLTDINDDDENVQPDKTISDTLKNNIDCKDELNKKRTSLKIENACDNIVGRDTDDNSSSNDGIDEFKSTKEKHLTAHHRQADNGGLRKSDIFPDCDNHKNDLDNNNKHINSNRLSSGNDDNDNEDDDTEGDYNDFDNGNTTDSTRKRDSITSRESSEDYFICEQLKNLQNCSMTNDVDNAVLSLELLSPNEGPMARRYAEIAHFKGNSNRSETVQQRSRRLPLNSIDSEDGMGMGDDDMEALLPNSRGLSGDDLSHSRVSLVSSSDGGGLAEGETSTESSGGSTSPACDLGLVERLLRTHPVWFLPGIQRAGAVHLLQGKEEGNFVVRGSSQLNTMAVSVRLPPDTGPYIEHYLIQSNDGLLSLESSRFKFDSIPALIAHYAQCCDELPVQLTLPQALREAQNRQQLSSLALLGQEFWRYPMASPKPSLNTSPTQSSLKTESSGIGTTVFSTNHQKSLMTPNHTAVGSIFSPTNPVGMFSQAGTPSDTNSSLSSFTSTGPQILSPESVDSVALTMSPIDSARIGVVGKTSTFKVQNRKSMEIDKPVVFQNNFASMAENHEVTSARAGRPTPPCTLNLAPLKTPPAPPPRWSKPSTPSSPTPPTPIEGQLPNNFTVTTTVTFSVEGSQNSQIVEVTSPNSNTTFQTISKRLSPEGECKTTVDTLSSQGSKRWQSQSSKDSSHHNKKIQSSVETPTGSRSRRSRARKESKHYQESDILESPQVYCRSALGDKISDYEDLWTQDPTTSTPLGRGSHMSSFRPDAITKRPDLLPETPTVTSLNGNILSPDDSNNSSNSSPPVFTKKHVVSPSEPSQFQQTQSFFNNNCKKENNQKISDIQTPSAPKPLFSPSEGVRNLQSFAVVQELQNQLKQQKLLEDIKRPSVAQQVKNRMGLNLPTSPEVISPTSDSTLTPTQTPNSSRSKQGSPFYAEPADALGNVIRRSQRNALLPTSHRHSEPPKGPVRTTPFCQVLSPIESEKSPISGSLDELKKKNRQARGRMDPWPLDSSWEFMGNDGEDNDYDTDANWKVIPQPKIENSKPTENVEIKEIAGRSLTVHQMISKRMPELNLPDLAKYQSPLEGSPNLPRVEVSSGSLTKGNRISSYDNVEKGHSGYAISLHCHDSTHSDDGTVFSEPWDSSQWDSFFPQDEMSESIHLSKCRPALCNSEDDTIMEEPSMFSNIKEQNQQVPHQRVATIHRTRSCRDREILCHPRNKITVGGPGESIGAYALALASDSTSTFSRNIENFISCTKESRELAPQVVMRNMRQFMSGMKNYLVKHGEGDFQREVQRARSRLKPDEFLNLDTILEGVMHKLVVLPLREHLYGLFVDYFTRTSDIQVLVENVKYASSRSATDFGIRPTVTPPSPAALHHISVLLLRLQEAELPLEKLDLLLSVVSAIFDSTSHSRGQPLGADDFLPILVYIVAKCGFISAEIEAEFMWCLLQQSLLSGEAGYYLTALCSAVHVLKSFMASENEGTGSLDIRSSSLPASSSVLRVIIPDECNGSLQTRTLPVRPHTTTKEVCRTIAHKARITNPQDYGLFKLVNGEETLLMDSDCPQEARLEARGKHCMLAYKRIDAKIAWPTLTTT